MEVLPIRKTAPDTVALTTFYGKNFVQRSQSQSANWSGWLSDQIVANGLSVDNPALRDLKFSNVFDPSVKLPRDYTVISRRLSGFTSGSVVYNFDASKIDEFFDKDEIKDLKKQSLTPVGKSKGATYGMDPYSVIYKKTAKGIEEVGRVTEVLGIDTEKAPKEFTELSMMGKSIPLAIIFAYYLGIENMLREFKVSYRTADASERVPKGEGDMVIVMKDSKLVLTFDNNEQELIFQGFKSYLKLMRDYTLHDFNQKDVYLNLIQKDGLSVRYLNELDLMEAMFVDPTSERILKKMGEPTHFKGLLKRANELVTLDNHKPETDMNEMHIYGYQRIAGAVYTGLVRGIRDHNNKPGSNKKIDIPSSAIWSSIAQDPSVMPASDANPIQSVKEADVVTFGGNGGRSRRSMVKRTRQFLDSDLGVISGDTVDSGDVGITSYMTVNPIFESMDGTVKDVSRTGLETSQYISSSVALAPGSFYDDDKRLTINIV